MLIIFSPALAFFGGRTFVKYKELQLKAGALSTDAMRRVALLERDNDDLRRRVETLETIATMSPPLSPSSSNASQLRGERSAAVDNAVRLKLLEQQVREESRALTVTRR